MKNMCRRRGWLPGAARLALVLGLWLASPVAGFAQCTGQGNDPFACLEVMVEYDAAFDEAAFHAFYGTTRISNIPQLQLLLAAAPDTATRDRILVEPFPGKLEADLNDQLIHPECRQLAIGIIELNHAPSDVQSQPLVAAVNAPQAWPRGDGSGVRVAIIDTGYDPAHPNLAGLSYAPGLDLVGDDADPTEEANGLDDDNDGMTDPGYGHGTALASLVGAIAPGAELLVIRAVDDECRSDAQDVAQAVVDATDRGAHIVNLSLGMIDDHPYVRKAIDYARDRGVLVVVPAGNGAPGQPDPEFPSRYRDALGVGATDNTGVKADFSAYGSDVDLVAPGVDVLGAYPGGPWVRADGTSFSAAVVSGVAALVLSAEPCMSGRDLERALADLATPVDNLPGNQGTPWDGKLGAGLANAVGPLPPASAVDPLRGLLLARVGRDRIAFHWHLAAPPATFARIYAVDTREEIALASTNTALCPQCPAASLRLICDAPLLDATCEEPAPGLIPDPLPLVFVQATGNCGGIDGAP